jgi:hypothetical protein
MNVEAVVPESVDYVFLANTFHGVPDKLGLAWSVAAILRPREILGIVDPASPTARGNGRSRPTARPSPCCDILNERYAGREINKVEYEEKRRLISQG